MKRAPQITAILALFVFSMSFAVNASAQTPTPTPEQKPAATPVPESTPAAAAPRAPQTQVGPVPGVYENFAVGKESGDLEGMRIVIFPAHGAFYAMVQIAQGGAEDPKPVFVDATVRGATVEFTANEQRYTGTVSIAGLRLRDPDGKTHVLRRRPCATLFR
jgi:hypothetical protein